MITFLKKRWVYHSLIWLFLAMLLSFVTWKSAIFEESQTYLGSLLSIILSLLISVYLSFYLKKRFFDNRQYWQFVIGLLVTVGIGVGIVEGMFFLLGNKSDTIQSVQNVAFIILIAIGLQYFKRGIINQYQLQELRAKNAETELYMLKTQLNPHFLFNTLNNIYAINQINAVQGSEMIMELSEVMRHHLSFSKQKTVPLTDTIQLIYSYVALEKLRLNENCDLQIDINTQEANAAIAPLLLLPFIENAFKHGTHPIQPCFIHILLTVQDNQLLFKVSNSVIQNKKTVKTYIGLENTKRRLAILYPNRHHLTIEQTDKIYQTSLTLDL